MTVSSTKFIAEAIDDPRYRDAVAIRQCAWELAEGDHPICRTAKFQDFVVEEALVLFRKKCMHLIDGDRPHERVREVATIRVYDRQRENFIPYISAQNEYRSKYYDLKGKVGRDAAQSVIVAVGDKIGADRFKVLCDVEFWEVNIATIMLRLKTDEAGVNAYMQETYSAASHWMVALMPKVFISHLDTLLLDADLRIGESGVSATHLDDDEVKGLWMKNAMRELIDRASFETLTCFCPAFSEAVHSQTQTSPLRVVRAPSEE